MVHHMRLHDGKAGHQHRGALLLGCEECIGARALERGLRPQSLSLTGHNSIGLGTCRGSQEKPGTYLRIPVAALRLELRMQLVLPNAATRSTQKENSAS